MIRSPCWRFCPARRLSGAHIRNQERLGPVQNFARAVSLCRGDYVALCDQDDIWDAEKLALSRPGHGQGPGTAWCGKTAAAACGSDDYRCGESSCGFFPYANPEDRACGAGTAENVAGAKFRDRLHRSGEPPPAGGSPAGAGGSLDARLVVCLNRRLPGGSDLPAAANRALPPAWPQHGRGEEVFRGEKRGAPGQGYAVRADDCLDNRSRPGAARKAGSIASAGACLPCRVPAGGAARRKGAAFYARRCGIAKQGRLRNMLFYCFYSKQVTLNTWRSEVKLSVIIVS